MQLFHIYRSYFVVISCSCLFPQIESEENVLICLRIIIELHKQFRPPISQEVRSSALLFEKKIQVLK